jgi:hypothetical protein
MVRDAGKGRPSDGKLLIIEWQCVRWLKGGLKMTPVFKEKLKEK